MSVTQLSTILSTDHIGESNKMESLNPITTKIAGIFNCPEGKIIMKTLKIGDELFLVPEPENIYDSNAIKVMAQSKDGPVKLGYIPKILAMMLKDKKNMKCTKGNSFDGITIDFS